ncbi:MAG: alpha/beta fold hydrolase [Acidimicrobiia bacterium]
MTAAPDRYRIIAPDMRNFGDTQSIPLDATRGLLDWADYTFSLVETLGIEDPVHLVGWSTGGAAIASYAIDRSSMVASLTFIGPVSPYGFGGTKDVAGTPISDDFATQRDELLLLVSRASGTGGSGGFSGRRDPQDCLRRGWPPGRRHRIGDPANIRPRSPRCAQRAHR